MLYVPSALCIGFNVETVEYKNIAFTVWDVGGQDKVPHSRREDLAERYLAHRFVLCGVITSKTLKD